MSALIQQHQYSMPVDVKSVLYHVSGLSCFDCRAVSSPCFS